MYVSFIEIWGGSSICFVITWPGITPTELRGQISAQALSITNRAYRTWASHIDGYTFFHI